MKNRILLLAFITSILNITLQAQSNDLVLLKFKNGETVSQSEFEYVYQKNNGGWEKAKTHSTAQYQEYLDLYIKFKRKVLAAKSKGMHQTEAFRQEFAGYKKTLSQPYLVEKSVENTLVKEAYDRSKEILEVSHILLAVKPEAAPNDTLNAYKKALTIRDSILKGADFKEMARRHSQDPSAQQNEGYLGYFSVFEFVYPFETGAYNTETNKVTMPVRSKFGYHLILVHDRIPVSGKLHAAHILVRYGPRFEAQNKAEAEAKISEIHQKLTQGESFESLAKEYSDDPTTASKGGDLGTRRLMPEMEKRKHTLKVGEYTKPFESNFGFHILMLTEKEPFGSFQEEEEKIRNRVTRDDRAQISQEKLIARIKSDYNFEFQKENWEKLLACIDNADNLASGNWRISDSIRPMVQGLTLYTLKVDLGKSNTEQVITIDDFLQFYETSTSRVKVSTIPQTAAELLKLYEEKQLLEFETEQLPRKYPEYKALLQEYKEGILLFTLTEEEVWRKAIEDTSGLKKYYTLHKSNFKGDQRVRVLEFISEKQQQLTTVKEMITSEPNEEELLKKIQENPQLNVRVRDQIYEKGKKEGAERLLGKEGGHISEVQPFGEAYKIVLLKEIIPAGEKSFQEAKAEVITAYQAHLEEKWNEKLSREYPVKIKKKALKSLFK